MVIQILSLAFLMSPVGEMPGIYCDEIMEVIYEYQEETGAFTEEEMEGFLKSCDGWEEEYEGKEGNVDK